MSQEFLKEIIQSIVELREKDSEVREDSWVVTGHTQSYSYVAFNKYRGKGKVVYVVYRKKDGLHLKLLVSVKNAKVQEFRDSAKQNNATWFECGDDCGIENSIMVSPNIDEAIDQVFKELDNMYSQYNTIIDNGGHSTADGSCVGVTCVERLPVRELNAKYDLVFDSWQKLYKYWDWFVENWFDSKSDPDDDFTRQLHGFFVNENVGVGLCANEFPEPYYGCVDSAQCVVVHLNPGASSAKEYVKLFGGKGFLIKSFEEDCNKKYSEFVKRWSPLKDTYNDVVPNYGVVPSDVPGNDWWHEKNRLNFIERFCGVTTLTEVFALEACPYHSKGWSGGMTRIEKHVIDKVITPAVVIASNTRINCAIFVGSEFNGLISKIRGIEAIKPWRGTRVYSLYKLTFPKEVSHARDFTFLLVINGMQGMWLPASNDCNDKIEREIKSVIGFEVLH